MISWHRVGQKVTPLGQSWVAVRGSADGITMPQYGEVYTIAKVGRDTDGRILFGLEGFRLRTGFSAKDFRPVYPTIIDQLRKLDAPSPELERVKEGV